MKPAIVGVEDGTPVYDPDSATLLRWAAAVHLEGCPQCRRGHEYCPAGQRIQDAAQPDLSWIPNPRTGD